MVGNACPPAVGTVDPCETEPLYLSEGPRLIVDIGALFEATRNLGGVGGHGLAVALRWGRRDSEPACPVRGDFASAVPRVRALRVGRVGNEQISAPVTHDLGHVVHVEAIPVPDLDSLEGDE